MMSLEALFCDVDDFCQVFLPQWEREQMACGERQRRRSPRLSVSEIMTIIVHFHQLSRAETADFRRQRKRGSCVCCGY
jgi:hypothetical protein